MIVWMIRRNFIGTVWLLRLIEEQVDCCLYTIADKRIVLTCFLLVSFVLTVPELSWHLVFCDDQWFVCTVICTHISSVGLALGLTLCVCFCVSFITKTSFFVLLLRFFCVFEYFRLLVVVATVAVSCVERFVSELTHYRPMSSGTLSTLTVGRATHRGEVTAGEWISCNVSTNGGWFIPVVLGLTVVVAVFFFRIVVDQTTTTSRRCRRFAACELTGSSRIHTVKCSEVLKCSNIHNY